MSDVPDALAIGRRLQNDVMRPMKHDFVDKDEIIDLMGVCLVAGENLFILGPPGTAKSALVHDLGARLAGDTFEYLLTRFTEPNELFGPFDIRKLRDGELVTNTDGMLPEASLVFLDELLNANSAILNSLLTVLNERVFRRGRETRRLPVQMIVGASNHLPEDEALNALFDRFLLRVHCGNVEDERLGEVLEAGWRLELTAAQPEVRVSMDDVKRLHGLLPQVAMEDVHQSAVALVRRLRQAGFVISDRRAVKMQRLTAASALICGRLEAQVSDLWCFRYIWETLEHEQVLTAIVSECIEEAEKRDDEHPRARAASAPDPDGLAEELDGIEAGLAAADVDTRGRLLDRLGLVGARCEWVTNDVGRAHLRERVDALWQQHGREP